MTAETFTPAMAHAERIEIRRAGGIRKWLRRRIVGATGIGYSLIEQPDKTVVKSQPHGPRQSVDGRNYMQLTTGEVRRVPPKVHGSKKARLATRRATAAKDKV